MTSGSPPQGEPLDQATLQVREFEERKQDHLRLSLSGEMEAFGGSGLSRIQLIHEAMPELDWQQVLLETKTLGYQTSTPFFVSSMTAGHEGAHALNHRLASACHRRGWWMGVGSQRRQLFEPSANALVQEWEKLRQDFPDLKLMGNLGLAQAIQSSSAQIQKLVDSLGAQAMVIHANALQECLQPEGTPQFSGGMDTLKRLTEDLSVPVVWKETGCGVGKSTLHQLSTLNLGALDVSGYGGTHWGRIEGERASETDIRREAALAFSDWGVSTLEALIMAQDMKGHGEIWASGGIRTGVDAAKCLALGAQMVGFAKPALAAALQGDAELDKWMATREFELRTAMFCTGVGRVEDLARKQVWTWRKSP